MDLNALKKEQKQMEYMCKTTINKNIGCSNCSMSQDKHECLQMLKDQKQWLTEEVQPLFSYEEQLKYVD